MNRTGIKQIKKIVHREAFPAIVTSKSLEFIPFVRERDRMNRLIPSSSLSSLRHISKQLPKSLSHIDSQQLQKQNTRVSTRSQKAHKILQVFSSFFKKIDLQSRQLLRCKNHDKKIFYYPEKISKYELFSQGEYDIDTVLTQIKIKCNKNQNNKKQQCPTEPARPTKTDQPKEPAVSSRPNKITGVPLRPHSMLQKKPKQSTIDDKTPIKKIDRLIQPRVKTSQNLLNNLHVKLNPEQPQYKYYKQQQERSLKIFHDYQIGHEKFRQKMRESKEKAQKIQKQLQVD